MTHTSPTFAENFLTVAAALGHIAVTFLLPALLLTAVVMFIRYVAAAPRYKVTAPAMPEYAEEYRTRGQAVRAARELTDEMGFQFSVTELV